MGKQSAPPQPNYGQITRDTLQAQVDLAPELYRVSAEYQPKYIDLAGREYNTFLNSITPNYTKNVMPQMAEASRVANTAQRTADINDISRLGPLAKMALENSNPEAADLVNKLTRQAGEGLDAGSMMTADELRTLNNSIRSSQGARGISYGPASSYEEAMAGSDYGQQLKQRRQQSALAALGANSSFYGDPFQQILGRPSQAFNSIGTIGSQASQGVQSAGPSLFNPNAGNDLYAGWQQSVAATNAGNSAATGAIIGGGLSALGSIGGGLAMGSASKCWAAREVFGAWNPKWLAFRYWMTRQAPAKLREWYLKHGEEWAERIRRNPECKLTIAAWMERRLV